MYIVGLRKLKNPDIITISLGENGVTGMAHNENSRVKIPAIAHLTRLGYIYRPLKQYKGEICPDTNIFKGLLHNAVN